MWFRLIVLISVLSMTACIHRSKAPTPTAASDMKVNVEGDNGAHKDVNSENSVAKATPEAVPPTAMTTGATEQAATAQVAAAGAAAGTSSEAKAVTAGKEEAKEMKAAVAAAAEHISHTHGKNVRKAGPVSADKSLGWLKNGNIRFVKGSVRNDGATKKDRERLAKGQQPHAIILSCSDSRVPPEVVFDQKLGEIFVIRTAGEALDDNAVGSIEYAVQHLGSNLIVVMGHESCGAVKAALSSLNGADLGSPALNGLVADLKPRLQKFAGSKMSEGAIVESWANVEGVAKDLLYRSQIIRDGVASGDVKIVRAMYHMESGQVEWR
jgi:carbonic anhydrase